MSRHNRQRRKERSDPLVCLGCGGKFIGDDPRPTWAEMRREAARLQRPCIFTHGCAGCGALHTVQDDNTLKLKTDAEVFQFHVEAPALAAYLDHGGTGALSQY